jgi:hypothetical protein
MKNNNPTDGTNGSGPAWPTEDDRVRAAKECYVSGETESLEALAAYFGLDVNLLEQKRRYDNWDFERRKVDEEKDADRAPNGRFLPGHGIKSPGRPRRDEEAAWLGLLRSEVTDVRWEAIVRKAIEQALRGDPRARGWLSDYVLPAASKVPVPDQRIEIVYESLDDKIERTQRVERLREAEGTGAIADGSSDDSADAPVQDFFDPPDDPEDPPEAAGRHAVAPDAMAT